MRMKIVWERLRLESSGRNDVFGVLLLKKQNSCILMVVGRDWFEMGREGFRWSAGGCTADSPGRLGERYTRPDGDGTQGGPPRRQLLRPLPWSVGVFRTPRGFSYFFRPTAAARFFLILLLLDHRHKFNSCYSAEHHQRLTQLQAYS